MNDPTDKRAAIVAGLRALADFIETHPDLPLPRRADLSSHVRGSDAEQWAEVDRIAAVLGVEPGLMEGSTAHYQALRTFGPVAYSATAITAEHMARHDALMSYRDTVTPDGVSR